MTTTATPGYNHRLDIWFQTDKRGRTVAYRWSYSAFRAIRMNLTDAELFTATGQANLLPGHPMKG